MELLHLNRLFKLAVIAGAASASISASASCEFSSISNWGHGYLGKIEYVNETEYALADWTIEARFKGAETVNAWGDAFWSGGNPAYFYQNPWQGPAEPGQKRTVYMVVESTNGQAASAPELSGEICGESKPTSSIPENAFIGEDFEAGTPGEGPEGWNTVLGYFINGANPRSSSESALIDSSKSYSGKQSLKIKVGREAAPYYIYKELPYNWNELYVRAWVNTPVKLGGDVNESYGEHASIFSTTSSEGRFAKELRLGENRGVLGGFLGLYDAFSTDITNSEIPANTWTCVEWALLNNAPTDKMFAWVNDESVLAAESSDDWSYRVTEFFSPQEVRFVNFGWFEFGNFADLDEIWFDDIVVSDERIGCN